MLDGVTAKWHAKVTHAYSCEMQRQAVEDAIPTGAQPL